MRLCRDFRKKKDPIAIAIVERKKKKGNANLPNLQEHKNKILIANIG